MTYKTDSDGHSRFYMSYFDTSTLPQPHHGYVNIRSTDPGFVTGREDLVAGAAGGSSRQWVAHTATTMASALGVGSWQYNDALDVWIEARANQVTFYPGDLASMEPSFPALDLSSLDFTAFHHRDHDSLARDPLGHSLPSTAIGDDRCGTVPLYHFSGAVPATPQGSACTIDAQCSVSDGAGHACDLQTHHCFDNNIYRADLIESSTTLRLSPATH